MNITRADIEVFIIGYSASVTIPMQIVTPQKLAEYYMNQKVNRTINQLPEFDRLIEDTLAEIRRLVN